LRRLGVKKGDKVCLFLPNCLEFLYLWFGLAKIGGVMVPLNINLRGEELRYIIHHCDARRIVMDEHLYPAFACIEKDLARIEQKIWRGRNDLPSRDFCSFKDLLRGGEDRSPEEEIKDEDPLSILYTTAATTYPRGIMISHFNYIHTGEVWAKEVIDFQEEDIFYTHLPLFEANAQMFTIMGSLVTGCPHVLKEKFVPSGFWDEIDRCRATVFNYNAGMINMLMKQPISENNAGHSIRAAFGGILSREDRRDFEKRFGIKVLEGFGWIESGGINLIRGNNNDKKNGSIGKPIRFFEVKPWDENNQEVPIGETGEIVVKGEVPYSMSLGYYKQPDRTAEAWDGGAFHTGDWGYKDADEYFYPTEQHQGRAIRRFGDNIFS
ncbi:MAG: AMP-binding protein, partial [Deltaproteobacteria bacterium]|nr:AMP-binding protein [Deltaproteobacteria bacterium]